MSGFTPDFRYVRLVLERADIGQMKARDLPRRKISRHEPTQNIPGVTKVATHKKAGQLETPEEQQQRQTRNYLRHALARGAPTRFLAERSDTETHCHDGIDAQQQQHFPSDVFPDEFEPTLRALMYSYDTPLAKYYKARDLMEKEQHDFPTFDVDSERRVADLLVFMRTMAALDPVTAKELASIEYAIAATYIELKLYPDAIAHAEIAMQDESYLARGQLAVGVSQYLMGDAATAVQTVNTALRTHIRVGKCHEEHTACVPFHFALICMHFLQKTHEKSDQHMQWCLKVKKSLHCAVSEGTLMDACVFMVRSDLFEVHAKLLKLTDTVGAFVKKGQIVLREINECPELQAKLHHKQELGPALEIRVVTAKQRLDTLADEIKAHVDVVDKEVCNACDRIDGKIAILVKYYADADPSIHNVENAAMVSYFMACVAWLRNNKSRAGVALSVAMDLVEVVHGKDSTAYITLCKYRAYLHMGYDFKDTVRKFELLFHFCSCTPDQQDDEDLAPNASEMISSFKKGIRQLLEADDDTGFDCDYTLVVDDLSHVATVVENSPCLCNVAARVEYGHVLLALIKALEKSGPGSPSSKERIDDLLTNASRLYMHFYGEGHEVTQTIMKKLHKRLRAVARPTITPQSKTIRAETTLMLACDTPGVTIYYRWDGGWQKYTGSVRPVGMGKQTLEVRAVKRGMLDSIVEVKEFMVIAS